MTPGSGGVSTVTDQLWVDVLKAAFLWYLKGKLWLWPNGFQLQCLFWHILEMKNPAATLWSVVCVCVCFPSSLWVARKCSLLVGVLIYHDEIITVHTLECWSSEVSVQSVSLSSVEMWVTDPLWARRTVRCCRAWPVMDQFSKLFKNIHRDDTKLTVHAHLIVCRGQTFNWHILDGS